MKRTRHTGLPGCVIMISPWKYLTIPKKETDHENPRNASHPGRHRRQSQIPQRSFAGPAQSLVIGSHGFHRPFAGQITQKLSLLSLIHISEPTRLGMISYAVFCLKKKT